MQHLKLQGTHRKNPVWQRHNITKNSHTVYKQYDLSTGALFSTISENLNYNWEVDMKFRSLALDRKTVSVVTKILLNSSPNPNIQTQLQLEQEL